MPAVVARQHHVHDALALVHAELGGQVVAQLARLAVGKVARRASCRPAPGR